MSEIRVTYSGLIGLVVGLVSIITGLVFSLIITRTLTPEEYGTWSLIGSMVAYFIIGEKIISYWTVRQVSRGEEVGKTATITSGIYSLGAIPLYLAYVVLVSSQNNADLTVMTFGAILLPVYFISTTLGAINRGYKPHAKSFGILTFESLKIPGVLALVYFLDLGINGVIIAITLAHIAKIFVQIFFAKKRLRETFSLSIVRRWFKLSWIPFYISLHRFTMSIDIVLYSVITGSVLGLAFYHVAFIIAGIISHSGMVSQALFPKLLSGGSHKHIGENFRLLMYFAIPLLAIAIIFSKPTLFALNPAYKDATIIVVFLSLKSFLTVITGVFYNILTGIERVDVEKNPSFSKLLRSKLFLAPTISLVHSLSYIGVFAVVLLTLNSHGLSELELVTWWAVISFLVLIPISVYLWVQVRKNVELTFPFRDVGKYVLATFAFVIVFLLTSENLIKYEISIYDFLPGLLLQAFICVSVYLGITYAIDAKSRKLFRSILNELNAKK